MRQRISVEQLQELTEEQKKRLREWWNPEGFDVVMYEVLIARPVIYRTAVVESVSETGQTVYLMEDESGAKSDLLPLLSIGQCIELLSNKAPWKLGNLLGNIIIPHVVVDRNGEEMELIDALWSAVKSML